jgi:hypothetical protein
MADKNSSETATPTENRYQVEIGLAVGSNLPKVSGIFIYFANNLQHAKDLLQGVTNMENNTTVQCSTDPVEVRD